MPTYDGVDSGSRRGLSSQNNLNTGQKWEATKDLRALPMVDRSAENAESCSEGGCVQDGCNSIACPAGYRSTSETTDGVYPCIRCPDGFINPYIGRSDCYILNQIDIMKDFYFQTNGTKWALQQESWDRTDVPVCEWEGIQCNTKGDIISISLPNATLAGTVPENLGFLRHLEFLDLSDNALTGVLPPELSFAPLQTLYIGGNKLVGAVPLVLCKKQGLNDNGRTGTLSCDTIVCPIGTYSATGMSGGVVGDCMPCSNSNSSYLGSKSCDENTVSEMHWVNGSSSAHGFSGFSTLLIIVLVLVGSILFIAALLSLYKCCFRRRARSLHFSTTTYVDDFELELSDSPTISTSGTSTESSYLVSRQSHLASQTTRNRNDSSFVKESLNEMWLDVPRLYE